MFASPTCFTPVIARLRMKARSGLTRYTSTVGHFASAASSVAVPLATAAASARISSSRAPPDCTAIRGPPFASGGRRLATMRSIAARARSFAAGMTTSTPSIGATASRSVGRCFSISPRREPGRTATSGRAPAARAPFDVAPANSCTSGCPTNAANPPRKIDGSNGKKQHRRSSERSMRGTRPWCHAQTCGHTTWTALMPFDFAYAASLRFIPG